MYYKLFIFGSKELFALVEILGPPAKTDHVILYKGVKYKILSAVYYARDLIFDETGKKKYNVNPEETKASLEKAELPELYITEIPNF